MAIEELIEQLVVEHVLREDLGVGEKTGRKTSKPLSNKPLYHVTYFSRLKSISDRGLVGGAPRAIGSSALDSHAAKGVFLTDWSGVRFWFSRSEDFANHNSDDPYEDGLVPVVLRVVDAGEDESLEDDTLGSEDAFSDAFISPSSIEPSRVEIWDGSDWISIEDFWEIDTSQAFTVETDEDTGEELRWFKSHNPLLPTA